MEIKKRKLTIVATSDTHGHNDDLLKLIQDKEKGDIFIHGGDFTRYGKDYHFENFIDILKKLDFKHKIVIAGNHEISLDENMTANHKQKKIIKYPCKVKLLSSQYSRNDLLKMLNENCTYLEHEMIEVEGIKIFGSPFTKKHGGSAFQYDRKFDEMVWKDVPKVDILLSHSPPRGVLDKINAGDNVGSDALRKKVFEIKPKFHLFGHIHQARGQMKEGGIHFINMAKHIVKFQIEV